ADSRTLTPGGIVNDGNSGNNYSYTFNTASGTISKPAITMAAVTDSKTYDGTTTSSLTPTFGSLQSGDSTTTFSQAFDSRNFGIGDRKSVVKGNGDDGGSSHSYKNNTTNARGNNSQRTTA